MSEIKLTKAGICSYCNMSTCIRSHVKLGVSQGSVLRQVLFALSLSPVSDIARKYGLNVHLYADDTQNFSSYRAHKVKLLM